MSRHPWLRPRVATPVLGLLLVIHLPFLHWAFRGAPAVTAGIPFEDEFNRAALGDNYFSNGGLWRIVDGQLYSPGVGNNPLWLKARLPAEARIEFDARSEGPDGDIKFEAWGDGRNHSTGYVFIFGGWHNRETRLAKLDEHALTADELRAQLALISHPYPQRLSGLDALVEGVRAPLVQMEARSALEGLQNGTFYKRDTPVLVKRTDLHVEKGRFYHMRITRQGKLLRWEIDDKLALELDDAAPLAGSGHDRFGFSSWQNDTYFDKLKITPL